MKEVTITQVAKPTEDDLTALKNGLLSFNVQKANLKDDQEISSFIKDCEGVILGGVYGKLTAGWLYIDWLWVSDECRSAGYGTRLLQEMEQFATFYDIRFAHLETTSYQALDFYKKNGYTVFAELNDKPPGHVSYFLKKELQPLN